MLLNLHVKNLALIDEIEIEFGPNLNILSGETGAGKSIVIGSINLALGAKANKELIRKGEEYALVELLFQVEHKEQQDALRAMDIFLEEDHTLLITRKIMDNRSVSKVNGETVTGKQLKQLANLLIDIHGQHEHQSLLDGKKQLTILDGFAPAILEEKLKIFRDKLKNYQKIIKELDDLSVSENGRFKEADLAAFELEEIENAALKLEEDVALEIDYRKMVHSQKICQAVGSVQAMCGYDDCGAGSQISKSLKEIRQVIEYDESLNQMEQMLYDLDAILSDLSKQANDYLEMSSYDHSHFVEVEERLNLINHLKDKYGKTIDDILAYQEEQKKLVEKYQNYDIYKANLEKELSKLEEILTNHATEISEIRKAEADSLSKQMQDTLIDLNFAHADFKIMVEPNDKWTNDGADQISFCISTNPGEERKPLANVASGGELSRIMLALKTVLAKKDQIETLIFDEIDTGISGKTAWKVSEKMGILSGDRQIICITHLPQIAAMADKHFLIEKNVLDGHTTTSIHSMDMEEEIEELSRMLGGDEITEAVRENAREMKRMAKKQM